MSTRIAPMELYRIRNIFVKLIELFYHYNK